MTRFIFRMSDTAVAFLWTWFGIRRRWLLPPFALLALVDAEWKFISVVFTIAVSLQCLVSFWHEKIRCAEAVNLNVLRHREHGLTRVFVWYFVIMAVVSVAGIWTSDVSVRDAVSQVCILGFYVLDSTLIPSGPRRKIKWPKLSFAKTQEALA